MRIIFTILICLPFLVSAQCDQAQFEFNNFTPERITTYYGSNLNVLGDTIDLEMDIYLPETDTFGPRPAVVFAFGGGFTGGSKRSPIMASLCTDYARNGILAVSIDYRLFPQDELGRPDSLQLSDAVIKAVMDMKAAVRHLRMTVDQGNPYSIDPDHIYVGGFSAGAFMALHTNIIKSDDIPDFPNTLEPLLALNGGIDGNTGSVENRLYSSDVSGTIAFSGAVFDTLLIDANDQPIYCLHGAQDQTVPIGSGMSVNTASTQGSDLIIERAENLGLDVIYERLASANHTNYWFPFIADDEQQRFFDATKRAIVDSFCTEEPSSLTRIESIEKVHIYPNPVSQFINLKIEQWQGQVVELECYNALGQLQFKSFVRSPNFRINASELQQGLYFLRVHQKTYPFIKM